MNGSIANIRVAAGNSQDSNTYARLTGKMAAEAVNVTSNRGGLFDFSAACWYFAEGLSRRLAAQAAENNEAAVVPIGVLDTAIGGTMIEQWTLNSTLQACKNISLASHNEGLYDENVIPYIAMTVKGFVWYQGENDMHGIKGNSHDSTGYGCMMPAMVALWRKAWSRVPGTTDPMAPFGIVSLAHSGGEGGPDMGTMVWAQTGNYGTLPNKVLPNTFLAHAYDLDDPWGDKTCYEYACCSSASNFNRSACDATLEKQHLPNSACDTYCEVLRDTPVYMGGIHPRIKKPVGDRLATAAMSVAYDGGGITAGPQITGCSMTSSSSLTVTFDPEPLGGESVIVAPYNHSTLLEPTAGLSAMQVLLNESFFCIEVALLCQILPNGTRPTRCAADLEYWACRTSSGEVYELAEDRKKRLPNIIHPEYHHSGDAASGIIAHDERRSPPSPLTGAPPRNPFETAWITLPVQEGKRDADGGAMSVVVDLSPLNGSVPVAIRYAWGIDCCKTGDPAQGKSTPCAIEGCPIKSSTTHLPANPFLAKLVKGKCECIAPQVCNHHQ
jgi:sialate O-acetylesterase